MPAVPCSPLHHTTFKFSALMIPIMPHNGAFWGKRGIIQACISSWHHTTCMFHVDLPPRALALAALSQPRAAHHGNQSSCPEEAGAISDLVAEVLRSNATWTDREGIERAIGLDDILIIAP